LEGMTALRFCGFLVVVALLACALSVNADEEFYKHLSGMTPYNVRNIGPGKKYEAPEQCRLSDLDAVFRHGSRYPSRRAALAARGLEALLDRYRDKVLLDWMKDWHNPYSNQTAELLCQNGIDELYQLGARYSNQFKEILLPYNPILVHFTSTFKTRASQSGVSFGNSMINDKGMTPLSITSDSREYDKVLRFFDNCPVYKNSLPETLAEARQYLADHIETVADHVAQVTGLPKEELLTETANVSALESMWDTCQSDYVVSGDLGKWCSVFSLDDAKVFEYYDDMVDFYTFAFSNNTVKQDMNMLLAGPLLKDMLDHLNSVNVSDESQFGKPHAALRFAHAETVIPITAIMQLFSDGEPLKASWSQEKIDSRRWRNNLVAPLATNIALLRFECTEGSETNSYVQLLHNELVYPIPACGGKLLCPLEHVMKVFAPILDNDWDAMCAANTTVDPSTFLVDWDSN